MSRASGSWQNAGALTPRRGLFTAKALGRRGTGPKAVSPRRPRLAEPSSWRAAGGGHLAALLTQPHLFRRLLWTLLRGSEPVLRPGLCHAP